MGVITLNELTRSTRKREKRSGFKLSSIKAESAQASTQPRIEADRKLGAFAECHSAIRSALGHSRPSPSAPKSTIGRDASDSDIRRITAFAIEQRGANCCDVFGRSCARCFLKNRNWSERSGQLFPRRGGWCRQGSGVAPRRRTLSPANCVRIRHVRACRCVGSCGTIPRYSFSMRT